MKSFLFLLGFLLSPILNFILAQSPIHFDAKVDFVTAPNGKPSSVAIGDLDGDGKPDMVVVNSSTASNTISVFLNTATSGSITAASFAAKVDFATGNGPHQVAIGDIDGDGKPELVVANQGGSSVSVLRNTASSGSITAASFAAKVDFAAGGRPFSVGIGDIDGDGKPDVAVANQFSDNVSVLLNTSTTGNINFAAKADFAAGDGAQSVAIGDIDGDGKPDVAVANFNSDNLSVLRNTSVTGSVSFAAKIDFTAGDDPYSIAIGDIDGDGKPDLATANNNSSNVSLFHNNSVSGSISFDAKADFATGLSPRSVAIGHIDGDGKPDVVVAAIGANSLSVFRNTSAVGSISLAARVDFTTAYGPYSLAIGDLDGDGRPDLASANFNIDAGTSNYYVSVLRNADIVANISTTGALTSFTTCTGIESAEQSFTVSGNNLTAVITVTAPMGFEVSKTSGSGFNNSVMLTQSGGNVASITIYVRLAATATGTPSGNITVASTGATTQNVAVSGTVNTGTFTATTQAACGSYTWATNGQTYTASGTYLRIYNNANGCASADTLYLTINTGKFNSTTISGCNIYTWAVNGKTYTTGGTYIYNYNNESGCASADTLKLTLASDNPEICNGIDDNCNGLIDEGLPTTVYYQDADGDGYGNVLILKQTCSQPSGYASNSLDCNDNNASIKPTAIETCNAIDDNCNSQIDEGLVIKWYRDADSDGFGNPSISKDTCSKPGGYVSNNSDCFDNNSAIKPGATEICNGIDDNCNSQIDEGLVTKWYRDADGDGFGNPSISKDTCSKPGGYVSNNSDCFDNNSAIKPGATEICNGIDDNCNKQIDEGLSTKWYRDADGDGYGNVLISKDTCAKPNGYVNGKTDCNDNSASVSPGAMEVCNGIDDDCNNVVDDGLIPATPVLSVTQPTCAALGSIVITNKAASDFASINNGASYQLSSTFTNLQSGNYTVLIKRGICKSNSVSVVLNNAGLAVSIDNLDSVYYNSDPLVVLKGSPVFGVFKIDGVLLLLNVLSPSSISLGNHTISYTAIQGSCTVMVNKVIKIKSGVSPLLPNQCYIIEGFKLSGNTNVMSIGTGAVLNSIILQEIDKKVDYQHWRIDSIPGGYFKIKNVFSGLYLTIQNNGNIIQSKYSSPSGDWTIRKKLASESYEIISRTNNKYLTAKSNNQYGLTNASVLQGITSGLDQNYGIKPVPCPVTNSVSNLLEQRSNERWDVNIYPNPSSGLVNLAINGLKNNSGIELFLYNSVGVCIHKSKIDVLSNIHQSNLDFTKFNLSDGIYILRIQDIAQSIEKKLMIRK